MRNEDWKWGEEGREISFNSNIISRKLSRNVFAKDVS